MRLKWHAGHVWRNEQPLKVDDLSDDHFEFKFVKRQGEAIVAWQGGENLKFDLRRMILTVKQLELPGKVSSDLGGCSPLAYIDNRTKIRLETST